MTRSRKDVKAGWGFADGGAAIAALAIALGGVAGPAQQAVANPDLVVNRPVVNMFRHPTAESDVVSQVIYGTGVALEEKRGEWERIGTADGYAGWVLAQELLPEGKMPYAAEGRAVRVAALSANVYREPDVTRHAPVLRLPMESYLEVAPGGAAEAARWLRVRLADGELAWVQWGDVRQGGEPLEVAGMVEFARRFQGVTYTWGGVSSFGFDCSGFTQMLERQRGVTMPRDADVQAAWSGAIAIERKDLQAGDLLFFGKDAAHITHTGMYVGKGEFIHDTVNGHPGVQISRLEEKPWTGLLVAARRIR
jgi:hypothetical protein